MQQNNPQQVTADLERELILLEQQRVIAIADRQDK
jgi:hypothetical protein